MYNCSEACEGNVCARLCGNSSCLCSRRCAVTTRQAGSGCDVGALEFHLRTVLGHQSLGGVVGNHRPLLSFMTSDEFLYIKYGGVDANLSLKSLSLSSFKPVVSEASEG